MAGKVSKKSSDNFEKMKREMRGKKQMASMQTITEVHIVGNNNQVPLASDWKLSSDEHIIELLVDKGNDAKNTYEMNKQLKEIIVEKGNLIEEKKIGLVVFYVGEEEFAISILNAKEIIRVPLLTKVPNAPLYIAGLCSVRGDLLPVIDSHRLFGMQSKEYNYSSRIIITDIHGKQVGIISDKVSQVLTIDETDIKKPPRGINRLDEVLIKGIVTLDKGKRIVLILDSYEILKTSEFNGDTNEMQGLSEKTISLSRMKVEEEQIITFNVGDGEYALNINNIKEIIRLPDVMKIPNTMKFIEGIFSIRGELLAVMNLSKLMNVDCKKPDEYNRVVIIDNGSSSFGIIVDRVREVISFQKDLFVNQSQLISDFSMEYIKGIVNLNDGKRLVMMLEPNKLIKIADVSCVLELGENKRVKENYFNVSEAEDMIVEQFVVFKIDKEEYGIRVENVQEVNIFSKIGQFPGTPNFIRGIASLRGDLIPILNLKTLFNNNLCTHESSKFLVVEYQNKKIGIMIDSVSELLKVSKRYLEEATELFNDNQNYIHKIAKINCGKRIVLILNLSKVLFFM